MKRPIILAVIKIAQAALLILMCPVLERMVFSAQMDRDPILETQSKAVPVTEETLKEGARSGAPSPTFKLINDTGEFYVQNPMEQVGKEKKKKRGWWIFSNNEKKEAVSEKDLRSS